MNIGAFPARPADGHLPISQIFYTDEGNSITRGRRTKIPCDFKE